MTSRKLWLIIKVQIIYMLMRFNFIPRVWYKSELDLAKIRGQELYDFFNGEKE